MKEYCTLAEAVADYNERGAAIKLSFMRKITANLPYTRISGALRIYRSSDIKTAFELSFKTPKQRARAELSKYRQKELD